MIIGINIDAMNAKINKDVKLEKKLSVTNVPGITSIEKAEVLELKDVILIKFSYKTNYEPDIGEILIEGHVLYKDPDAKKFLKKWEDKKEIDKRMAVEVLNGVFRKCLTRAIDLSLELRLPPPIQFPIVTDQPQEEQKD
ncbi:MAG: hypothetical protein ABIA21_01130 [Candidatus Aenigmatarchaeota archaeon]